MPRLLLVDDNPSIHRIAESLLAPTDIELVCVDSAAEALDRLARGERFDVALVDTAMPGMDGWTLLTRLRAMEETARMPIALMAGVLDPVDPAKLAKAPIQGFLKKPIELRELGDRVKALLATPVVVAPSPFSTVPSTPARDLVKRAEEALPELRPVPMAAPFSEPVAAPVAVSVPAPAGLSENELDLSGVEEDLLLLTAEDLWPEEPASAAPALDQTAPILPDIHLELEELDLDSLQDLAEEPLPLVEPLASGTPAAPFAFEPALPDEDEELVTLSGLEDLEAFSAEFPMAPAPEAIAEPIPEPASALISEPVASAEEVFADLHDELDLIGAGGPTTDEGLITLDAIPEFQESAPAAPEAPTEMAPFEPAHFEPAPSEPAVDAPAAAGGPMPAASGQPVPASVTTAGATSVSSEQARAVVQALLADPVLVDALVKAVVSRMGDQVLREIAWEVMPDLAGRLQQ